MFVFYLWWEYLPTTNLALHKLNRTTELALVHYVGRPKSQFSFF